MNEEEDVGFCYSNCCYCYYSYGCLTNLRLLRLDRSMPPCMVVEPKTWLDRTEDEAATRCFSISSLLYWSTGAGR